MEKKVMEVLASKYAASKDLDKIEINAITYLMKMGDSDRGVTVRFSIKFDHWICECNYIILLGLPCEHLIRIIEFMKGSLSYYINSRWFHTK